MHYKEIHTVRGVPVRILSDLGLANLIGAKADLHLHSPAMKALKRPIYSVLIKGKVVGHTDNIAISGAVMKVNHRELAIHLNSPTGAKTRNTFIRGTILSTIPKGSLRTLKVRPGSITDDATGEDISSNIGTVHLGPKGPRYL